jgi:hypothetical protein
MLHTDFFSRRAALHWAVSGWAAACTATGFAQTLVPPTAATDMGKDMGMGMGLSAWDALLKKHVRWLPDQKQSRVNYKGLMADRAALQAVLAQWSAVSAAQFEAMDKPQRMAFLINAYNGFTLELILTRYPQLKSIKDLGSVFESPWKNAFFSLLGKPRHLDWIEHEQLRALYREPRIHAAVNCASIGCPALRPEAFTAARLEAQLADGMQRFLSDTTRNRFNPKTGKVELNAIFKWFREDFENGDLGFHSLEDLVAHYADQLSDDATVRGRLRAKTVGIAFLEYDWSLNQAANQAV